MKRKKKPEGEQPLKKEVKECIDAYKTVKCPLKAILRNYDKYAPQINNIVIRCNDIVIETYQFIRLFVLDKYRKNQPIPEIDSKFISYCISAIGKRDARGKKAINDGLTNELIAFYEAEYKTTRFDYENRPKLDLRQLTFTTPYLAIKMETAIKNNLKEHFVKRLFRFINKTVAPFDEHLPKEDRKKYRKALKDVIYNNESVVPIPYVWWFRVYRKHILPDTWDMDKGLAYDVKANPFQFLKYSFYMNEILEDEGFKLFQPLSLRNSVIPHYVTMDTASLVNLLTEKGEQTKSELLKDIKENQEQIWNKHFKLDTTIFRKKNYRFNYTIETDGVGVSLLFVHKDYEKFGKKEDKEQFNNEIDFKTIEDLDVLKYQNIVGLDPGKLFLAFMVDENGNKLKYSAFQRRTESLSKRNCKILRTEKLKSDIIEKETALSNANSKTVKYEKFKTYLVEKNKLNEELRSFYHRELYRKMKLRQFIYTQKSEDRFINKTKETFGKPEDVLIAYGNWSRTSQMKHFVPTLGVGMKRLIAKHFDVVMVDEFRTSKLCNKCHCELCNYKKEVEGKDKKVFRCLTCKGCVSSESEQPAFITRDLNSALNIRNLAREWIERRTRPLPFRRS